MANIPGKGKVNYMPVSDTWLGVRNGIAGYNQMMLSREFYQLFNDTEYLLICHTDAWIFRDELEDWCKKDMTVSLPHGLNDLSTLSL